jgi:hypothetical protein
MTGWIVQHDHNDLFLQYRALDGRRSYWTRDGGDAEWFATEGAALTAIVTHLNGKGRAIPYAPAEPRT